MSRKRWGKEFPLQGESHHGGFATRKLMKIATPLFVAGLTGVIPAFREGIFEVGKGEGLFLKSVSWLKSEKLILVLPTDSLEDPEISSRMAEGVREITRRNHGRAFRGIMEELNGFTAGLGAAIARTKPKGP